MNFKRPLSSLIASIALISMAASVQAGNPFSDMKNKLKNKASSKMAQKSKGSVGGSVAKVSAGAGSSVALGSPSSSLTSMTNCATLKPSNITIGKLGPYTFQQGFTKEKRTGLIGRKSGSLSNGCILPSLQSREVVYMEVDTAAFNALGSSNDWKMQCVKSANPGAGAVSEKESDNESPKSVSYLSGKDLMLHCGNSEGVSECGEGSNSSRSGQWKKKLKSQGKTMLSVLAVTSPLAPAQGEKLYCQYYNKNSGKSLFAFEYMRLRN